MFKILKKLKNINKSKNLFQKIKLPDNYIKILIFKKSKKTNLNKGKITL